MKFYESHFCSGGANPRHVSIPSRGFWFFEVHTDWVKYSDDMYYRFQSPRGDFGFLKLCTLTGSSTATMCTFQSPRGDFGFLKSCGWRKAASRMKFAAFQSPRGDFGFLKATPRRRCTRLLKHIKFQSPRGDFGFLKEQMTYRVATTYARFNPLAGILVF